ncbi:MAG TPA: STAS domain-containing protein [Rhizomicrobium sp.]|nr:STAS domain-containing protein [Rhizomicrobium sp.]
MDLHEKSAGGAIVAAAAGRIDLSNADSFKDALSASLVRAKTALILDLSGVEYISSAGLRALMIVFKTAKAENKGFGIAALQPLLVEIFTISRFNQVFPLFDNVRDGVAKLAPDALSQLDARS